MKLLCVSPGYWPAFKYGGPIASVHALNRALVKKGVNVTVYATNAGLDGKVSLNDEVDIDGVKVTYFRFVKLLEFIGRTGWQFSWEMTNTLRRTLKAFDLIHINAVWNYPTAVAAYFCRHNKKPYIISPRGVLYPYTAGKNIWKKLPYYYLITKRDLKCAAAIHYTTKNELEKCHLFLGLKNRSIIIPNGIDLSEFNELPDKGKLRDHYSFLKDKKVVLFLGRIHWKKGFDLLAKAYGRLARERKDVHLLIVGPDEGGYGKKVRGWLQNESVLEQATFTGVLNGKEKIEAFVGSDIFVLPSYSENFGMAVIEAMACRLPVVISNQVGIHREVQRAEAGLIVRPNSTDLYSALIRLLDNSKEASEIGKQGRKLVEEQFAIEKVADRMIEAFKRVIDGR
jgi:glycosyltransferase involved in cell wall biosynthesis